MAFAFSTQQVIDGLANPTSLQFGPDERLYVSQQNGLIQVYTVSQSSSGIWTATLDETIDLIRNIPNHNDDGTLNASIVDRQVTGVLVAGTSTNPVLYVTSSDPRIANFTDLNLDTNSGILSQLTWNGTSWDKVDLIRGLPRSEENHSANGMALSEDGTTLYLTQGGNTNNGAPSHFFANTPEYALAGTILEIDLAALAAMPDKLHTYASGVTSVYRYDLPTLDDPNVPNDGLPGNETASGMDIDGPFGGRDGLNMAVLPADAPLRIFATGLRNTYDVVITQSGQVFTIDNGANADLGGTPLFDSDGLPTNEVNNGGLGSLDYLYLLEDGGYYGHPAPIRANQSGTIYGYTDGLEPQVHGTVPVAWEAVPDGVDIAPGYVIDPSKFTADSSRLSQEGQFSVGVLGLAQFGASTNGLMEYTATAFGGEITGDLVTASFDGTVKLIQLAADGVTVTGVINLATPGGIPLDVTQGPDGTIWVAQIGAGAVIALVPSSEGSTSNPDIDGDGLLNVVDPFQADAANGLGTFLAANSSYNWNFQFGAGDTAPGPSGLFLGLTGHMTNGTRDFVAPVEEGGLDLNNVKIGTAAGGGLVVIENVSTGTASGSTNTGEFVFQTGVALSPDIEAFDIKWTAINPFPGLADSPTVRQIGGFIGTGDQDNFIKVVAGPNGSGNILFELESNGVVLSSQSLAGSGLLTAPSGSSIIFNLAVDRAISQAVPSITYASSSGPITVSGAPINLQGTSILAAIDGSYSVQGQASGLAIGLWSSNTGEGSQTSFQASFDDILITTSGGTSQLIKAVNVGGGQFTSSGGIVYEADAGPTSGGAESQVFTTGSAIAGTTDDVMFSSERWTPGGSYTYEIPVDNGTYRVDLHLAEIYSGIFGSGQRVFDMALEGQALAPLQDIDIYSQVGPNAALTISQEITVSDGSLSIQVGPGSDAPGNVENAKLNGFAIFSLGAAPTLPTLSIAAASASKPEGNSGSTAFTFTVSRAGDTSGTSSAIYTVSGNGATASDFTGGVLPSGTISFAAGETSKTLTINVAGDTTVEPDEGFTVTLSQPAGATIATASASGTILNDDGVTPPAALAKLLITPGTDVNASTFNIPSYELTNTGNSAITTFSIDLHNSLIAGNVFDPFGTFGDTTALDLTPYGNTSISASWSYGPTPVTEGGYKTLTVTFDGSGLAPGQTFSFRLDADPASIEGPAPGPNEAGSISGFEHVGAALTIGLAGGATHTAEVFVDGSAGGGVATVLQQLSAAPVLAIAGLDDIPLVTAEVGGILKSNLPGLNDLAGSPGDDILVLVQGGAGQTIRLSLAEIGGVGQDIPLGSHEGNTVLQDPLFFDVTLDASGSATVALALPAETPLAGLASGSVSGLFALTAAAIDPLSGNAISLVSSTLVVKDAPNSFVSESGSDTFRFHLGFATTDIFSFDATGTQHDVIGLEQELFPGMTVEQFLASGAVTDGPNAGDVNITAPGGELIRLHDETGTLTASLLQGQPQDFFFF
ncbi:MAG: hypothetical protein KF889_27565 [Alphaproteobacteria bacterium]|nr:hypothetical protein [Alphaproteobacteria bacterium]MCW5743713.1 hypothetical protein [Alphaproteobacteria bacterium]